MNIDKQSPYLSVVAVSRNDDHGGDPLLRTQLFIDNLTRQCERLKLSVELIIVDWNPVRGRPGLSQVLSLQNNLNYVSSRVITVPSSLHETFKSSDKLQLFQMIGKNVGIRRAKGRFVLATNIDILFSDELITFIGRRKLRDDRSYRVDRFDISSGINLNQSTEEVLNYAWNNRVRESIRFEPQELVELYKEKTKFNREILINEESFNDIRGISVLQDDGCWQIHPDRDVHMSMLHTNACGDFTLMSKKAWEHIGGYPEFESYSFNIDSMGLIAAHYAGIQEITLLPPCVCFHIEHSLGSGWTPEGESLLFERLRKNDILSPEWPMLIPLVEKMRSEGKAIQFNDSNWGLVNFELPEAELGQGNPQELQQNADIFLAKRKYRAPSINWHYDLDRLTLIYERQNGIYLKGRQRKASSMHEDPIFQLYIPNSDGDYSEINSIKRTIPFGFSGNVIFEFQLENDTPLRLDPLNCKGMINVNSLLIIQSESGKTILKKNGKDLAKIFQPISELTISKPFEQILIMSSGYDPQLALKLSGVPKNIKLTMIFNVDLQDFISH